MNRNDCLFDRRLKVKEAMKNFMNLQLQNYDAEMRGETIQVVSLHRVFFGKSAMHFQFAHF